jgi:hypothetical protein
MPAYETFPSLTAEAIVRHGPFKYERPNAKSEYEVGPEEVLLLTSTGRYKDISVTMILRADTDYQTVMTFLEARGLEAEPFYYTHPWLGTGLVRYNSHDLEVTPEINGNPAWFRLELVFRGQWNA